MLNLWLYFVIYAFLGWILEGIYQYIKTDKIVNRGFLHGPFVPLYGVGLVVFHFFYTEAIAPLDLDLWFTLIILFGFITIISSLIELLTGAVIETLFHLRYWDYSDEPCNINGYITCKFSLAWGVLGTIVFYFLHLHLIIPMIERIDINTKTLLSALLLGYFIIDWTLTVISLINFNTAINKLIDVRKSVKTALHKQKTKFDQFITLNKLTDFITESKDMIKETLDLTNEKHLKTLIERLSSSRLYKAFPHLKIKHKRKNKDSNTKN